MQSSVLQEKTWRLGGPNKTMVTCVARVSAILTLRYHSTMHDQKESECTYGYHLSSSGCKIG